MTQLTKEELLEEFDIRCAIKIFQEFSTNSDGEPEEYIDTYEGYKVVEYVLSTNEGREYFATYPEAKARQAEIVEIEFNKITN